jgi:hypothetical protein
MSLINTVTSASGWLHDQVLATLPPGSTVRYTSDGMEENTEIHFNDGYQSRIPGCPIGAAVQTKDMRSSVNAFVDQETVVGSNVTLTTEASFFNPITQQPVPVTVDVTFSEVTQAGRTMVLVQSNHKNAIGGFTLDAEGFQASVLEITTTARYTGTIEICTHYPDADSDGFVDGTTLPETEMKFLHGEFGTFVDRTSSRDVDANIVCSIVDSLSPFMATVPRPCAAAPREDCPSDGLGWAKIALLRDPTDPAKNKLKFQIEDWFLASSSSPPNYGNPTMDTGYQLCVYDGVGLALEATVIGANQAKLDTAPWRSSGTNFKFREKTGTFDGITSASLTFIDSPFNPAWKIKLKGKGSNLPMPNLPLTATTAVQPLTVQFMSLDAHGSCVSSGLSVIDVNTEKKISAHQ